MTKITTFLQDFANDESGASAAEYALILAIVGAGIAGAAVFLGDAIAEAIQDAGLIINGTTDVAADDGTAG